MACAAQQHKVVVVANIFTSLDAQDQRLNATIKHITSVVYAQTTIAVYHKMHLFPTEKRYGYTPGPFSPTSFDIPQSALKFGLLTCYEGVYPFISRDWSQLDGLEKQGAHAILWSIGSHVPTTLLGRKIANRYTKGSNNVTSVFASQTNGRAVGVAGAKSDCVKWLNTTLLRNCGLLPDYTGNADVVLYELINSASKKANSVK